MCKLALQKKKIAYIILLYIVVDLNRGLIRFKI